MCMYSPSFSGGYVRLCSIFCAKTWCPFGFNLRVKFIMYLVWVGLGRQVEGFPVHMDLDGIGPDLCMTKLKTES